ncbi:hypothetical protein M0657_004309 [Pyricularia oryzae]|nr:hypothetical protein M9X92_004273 [Pyricularia oryzae]KAI7925143.1 hypothetical protein M0657_004309 [Pyricularia oryzae]
MAVYANIVVLSCSCPQLGTAELMDSGTNVTWISRRQAEKLELSIKATETLLFIGFTGHSFRSSECVHVPFLGKGDIRRQTKFCIAPPAVPIKMIVGCEFMEQHPGVLWDQQPPSRKVLLAVQPRMKSRLRQLCLECRRFRKWVVKRLPRSSSGETKGACGDRQDGEVHELETIKQDETCTVRWFCGLHNAIQGLRGKCE